MTPTERRDAVYAAIVSGPQARVQLQALCQCEGYAILLVLRSLRTEGKVKHVKKGHTLVYWTTPDYDGDTIPMPARYTPFSRAENTRQLKDSWWTDPTSFREKAQARQEQMGWDGHGVTSDAQRKEPA